MRYPAAITATILLSTTMVYAQARNPIPNGFRELKWGSSVTADFVWNGKTYTRPADDLRIGRLTAKSITYRFENKRLRGVNLTFEGESARKLESVFTENFGEGKNQYDSSSGASFTNWKSEQTNILMLVNETDGRSIGLVFFSERD